MQMISVSGIRGIAGKDLDIEDYKRWSLKFKNYTNGSIFVIGRDTRKTGNLFYGASLLSLLNSGAEVYSAGVISTPGTVYLTKALGTSGGIVVTASHNPPEWNGMKFIHREARFLYPEEMEALKKTPEKKHKTSGFELFFHGASLHAEAVVENSLVIKEGKRIKVAIDPGNGAAGYEAKRVAEEMGFEVIMVNEEPSGDFKRGPEPVPSNLKELEKIVKNKEAEIGFAFDPDGDRISLVDEEGRAVGEEYTFPLCFLFFLEHEKTDAVVNYSTSMLGDEIAERYKVKVKRAPVGEANIVKMMEKENIKIGGEGNGGFIMYEFNKTRDGILAMAFMLSLKRKFGSLKDVIDSLPHFYMVKKKIPRIKKLKRLKEKMLSSLDFKEYSEEDGLWIKGEDYFIHIRNSNTEPVTRIIIEGGDEGFVKEQDKRIKKICVE